MAVWKVLFVFMVSLGVMYGASLECTCPPLWTHYQGYCYRFFGPTKSWEEAEAHCKGFFTPYGQAHLASVHSSDEYDLVREMWATSKSDATSDFWLGATDQDSEGNFAWTDGTAFDYQAWSPPQPDNAGGAENCLHSHTPAEGNYYWNDIPCDRSFPYVCKVLNTA